MAGAAIAAAAAVLFRDVLFGGEAFFGRDMTPFFYPMKHFLARSVQEGEFPFWTPWILNGAPFFSSLQPGHLYPGSLVLYLLPMPFTFNLLLVFHFPLAGVGTYLLLRRWGLRLPAAVFGGLAFMLGGVMVSTGNFYNNVQTAAWLPWLLLTWDRFVAGGELSDALWFALACAVAFLGGGADLLALQLGLVFVYGLLAPWEEHRADDRVSTGRQLAVFGGMGLVALGLVAVQLLPFWEMLGRSVREFTLELDFVAGRSLEPAGLLHFLVPPALETGTHGFSARMLLTESVPWLLSPYPGLIVLAFAGYGSADRDSRRWSLFWGGVALFSVAFAMGRYSPIYRVFFEWLPPLRMIRYPEKFLILTSIGVTFLGARGLDRWIAAAVRGEGRSLVGVLAGVAAAAAGMMAALTWRPELIGAACGGVLEGGQVCSAETGRAAAAYTDVLLRSAALTAGAAVVAETTIRGALSRHLAAGLLILMAAVDLGVSHETVNPSVDADTYRERPWASRALSELDPDRSSYRYRGSTTSAQMGNPLLVAGAWELTNAYLDFQNLGPNTGQVFGHLSQGGNQGVELVSVANMYTVALKSPPAVRSRLMRAANVKYYGDPTKTADSLPGLSLVAESEDLPIRIFEVRDPVPRAYLVSGYRTAPDPDSALRETVGSDFPLRDSVVLTREADPGRLTGEDGSVRKTEFEGDRVDIHTQTDGRMLLVLTDRFYPGWRATVNGEPARIYRANGYFRAVVIPAGESVVQMRYRPPHFAAGLKISLASVLLWCGLLVYARRDG